MAGEEVSTSAFTASLRLYLSFLTLTLGRMVAGSSPVPRGGLSPFAAMVFIRRAFWGSARATRDMKAVSLTWWL